MVVVVAAAPQSCVGRPSNRSGRWRSVGALRELSWTQPRLCRFPALGTAGQERGRGGQQGLQDTLQRLSYPNARSRGPEHSPGSSREREPLARAEQPGATSPREGRSPWSQRGKDRAEPARALGFGLHVP